MDPTQQAPAPSPTFGTGNPISNMLLRMGAAGGNEGASDIFVAQGMAQLGKLMESNGGDPAQAMIKFVQTPEGQKIMAVPGAYKKLTEEFRGALTNPAPQATIGPANSGVISQNGRPMPGMTFSGTPVNVPGSQGSSMTVDPHSGQPIREVNPEISAVNGGQGSSIMQQNGREVPGSRVEPTLQEYNRRPGESQTLRNAKTGETSTASQPPMNSQELDYLKDHFCSQCTPQDIDEMARFSVAQTPTAQDIAKMQSLRQRGIINQREYDAVTKGQFEVTPGRVPGQFFLKDRYMSSDKPGAIQQLMVGNMGPGRTANPTWTNGLHGQDPSTFHSNPAGSDAGAAPSGVPNLSAPTGPAAHTPGALSGGTVPNLVPPTSIQTQPVTGAPAPATMPNAPAPGSMQHPLNPYNKQTQNTIQKYSVGKFHVIPEAVNPDGKIDIRRAYGPGAVMIAGAGLPAILQNDAGELMRWFDPRTNNERSETMRIAEQAQEGMRFLASNNLLNNRNLRESVESALDLFPEHEHKMNDPLNATEQLQTFRNLAEGQVRVMHDQASDLLVNQTPGQGDTPELTKLKEGIDAYSRILAFIPSKDALESMHKALLDGKLANLPSFATAGGAIRDLAGTAVKHGAAAILGEGTTPEQIHSSSAKQLRGIIQQYTKAHTAIPDDIKSAIRERLQELRGSTEPAKSGSAQPVEGPKAQPYAPEKRAPSVKEFTKNPTGATPFSGLGMPHARINNAFINLQQ
jgi:hypothetical protein